MANVNIPDLGTLAVPAAGDTIEVYDLSAATNTKLALSYFIKTSDLAANVATFLATPSGANLLAALTTKTGTGVPVFGTLPTFTTAIISPAMRPTSDSTTALQLQNAAGTAVVTVDTTNLWVGIGTNPTTYLDVVGNGAHGMALNARADAPTTSSNFYFRDTVAVVALKTTSGRFGIFTGGTIGVSSGTEKLSMLQTGAVGLGGTTAPTAWLHLPAGTATASTAPLKLTSGTNLTTPEAGAMEYNGRFSLTESGATRRFVVQAVASTKTTAGAPYTNDGYATITINGTDIRVMTTLG